MKFINTSHDAQWTCGPNRWSDSWHNFKKKKEDGPCSLILLLSTISKSYRFSSPSAIFIWKPQGTSSFEKSAQRKIKKAMLNIVISLRTGIHSSNISLQMDERFLRKLFTTPVKDLPFFCSRKKYFVTKLQNDSLCKRFTSFNPVANKRRLLFCRIVGQSVLLFDLEHAGLLYMVVIVLACLETWNVSGS